MISNNFWKSVAAGWIGDCDTDTNDEDFAVPEDDRDFDYSENLDGADDELD